MADAVTSQILQDGDKSVVMKFTNISDGSGEAAVKKVDVSALQTQSGSGAACTGVSIQQIWYECNGMSVDLLWDASTDVIAWTLSGFLILDPLDRLSITHLAQLVTLCLPPRDTQAVIVMRLC